MSNKKSTPRIHSDKQEIDNHFQLKLHFSQRNTPKTTEMFVDVVVFSIFHAIVSHGHIQNVSAEKGLSVWKIDGCL